MLVSVHSNIKCSKNEGDVDDIPTIQKPSKRTRRPNKKSANNRKYKEPLVCYTGWQGIGRAW